MPACWATPAGSGGLWGRCVTPGSRWSPGASRGHPIRGAGGRRGWGRGRPAELRCPKNPDRVLVERSSKIVELTGDVPGGQHLSGGCQPSVSRGRRSCLLLSAQQAFMPSGRCMALLSDGCMASSGADGDRTHDLSIANAALFQLSYCPVNRRTIVRAWRMSCQCPTCPSCA